MSASANPYVHPGARGSGAAIAIAGRLAGAARARRFRWFQRTMRPGPEETLLDVGSAGGSWSLAELDPEARVTSVDRVPAGGFDRPNQSFVVADACDLPFSDGEFDIAFSNSVIEHVAVERRAAFAREITRVARRYWVQTPNYWFPLEPHALLPGAQFLPDRARRLAWRASPRRISYEESLELLTRRELGELFDDALILRERLGPLTKSFIAIGPRHAFTPRPAERAR